MRWTDLRQGRATSGIRQRLRHTPLVVGCAAATRSGAGSDRSAGQACAGCADRHSRAACCCALWQTSQELTRRTTAVTTRIASCSCGQLKVRTQGEPVRVSVCHCLACQRRTGSVFGAQARFPREAAEITGASKEYVRIGDDGNVVTFYFCAACGATVHYSVAGYDDGSIAIPVGAFADPDFPPPSISVYEGRKHSWVGLPSDIEHLE